MLDRALGTQPIVRRKKQDNTSETSSNKNMNNPAGSSPVKSQTKRLYQDQPVRNDDQDPLSMPAEEVQVPGRSKSKPTSRPIQSQQEVASPAVRNIKMAKVPLTIEDMKSSTKPHLIQSAKHMEMRNSQIRLSQTKNEGDSMYKLKLVLFMIVSLIMVVFAMSPSRKGDSWKSVKSRKARKSKK